MNLDFPDDADWRIDSNLTLLSDQYYLEDFEIANYRTDPAPDNTLGIYRRDDDSLLSLYRRFRINDFYRADTRSPEVAFDQARAPLVRAAGPARRAPRRSASSVRRRRIPRATRSSIR